MNWELATFLSTAVIQLMGAGIIWGKLEGRVQSNESKILVVEQEQTLHTARLTSLEVRVSVAEAYQQGLKDGTSHMRSMA